MSSILKYWDPVTEQWIPVNNPYPPIVTSETPPPADGDTLWIDTSENDGVLKRYDSALEQWVPVSVPVDTQAAIDAKADKAGDTFTGPVVLPGDAVNPLEAVPKQQLDSATPGTKNSVEVDGGDIQLTGDEASPSSDKFYGTDGLGDRGWQDVPEKSVVSVMDYNATGDGVTDDTTAIQNTIDNAGGKVIWFPPGTYVVTSQITLTSNTHLLLSPNTVIDATGVSTTIAAFFATGSVSDTKNLGANALSGTDTISVTAGDEAAFSEDDLVRIKSNKQMDANQSKEGELHYVRSVSSGSIVLQEGTWAEYLTSDSATIELVTPVDNILISGGIFLGSGLNYSIGMNISFGSRIRVENTQFDSFAERALQFRSSVDISVRGSTIRWCSQDGLGYGVAIIEATQWISVSSSKFMDCRHGVTGGGGTSEFGRPRFANIESCNFYGGVDAGVDGHSAAQFWTITGNTITAASSLGEDGIVWQGSEVTIQNNIVKGAARHGIILQPLREEEIAGITIGGNVLSGVQDTGIFLLFGVAAELVGLSIVGNTTEDNGSTSIYLLTSVAGAKISNFSIIGNVVTRGLARGIWVRANNGIIEWGTIVGNRVNLAASFEALYVYESSGVVDRIAINGNTLDGGSFGIRAIGAANLHAVGNIAIGTTAGMDGLSSSPGYNDTT